MSAHERSAPARQRRTDAHEPAQVGRPARQDFLRENDTLLVVPPVRSRACLHKGEFLTRIERDAVPYSLNCTPIPTRGGVIWFCSLALASFAALQAASAS